jgi:hypothetical protein
LRPSIDAFPVPPAARQFFYRFQNSAPHRNAVQITFMRQVIGPFRFY